MKKSKFLKKSLAMLLALMLVVAMIPLSASAATLPVLEYVTVGGQKIQAEGTSFSATYPEGKNSITVQAAPIGTDVDVVALHNDGVNFTDITTQQTLKFEDFKVAENGTVTIDIQVKPDETTGGIYGDVDPVAYTLTLTPSAPSTDTGVKSVEITKAGTDAGILAASIEGNTINVTAAYGFTTTAGGISVTPIETAKIDNGAAGVAQAINVPAENGSQTFKVTSEAGVNTTWQVKTTLVPALNALSVAGVDGEFSDTTKDGKNDTITVTLPVSAIQNEYNEVKDNPVDLAVKYSVLANTSVEESSAAFESGDELGFTFNKGAAAGYAYTATMALTVKNGTASHTYNLKVNVTASNDNSVLNTYVNDVESEPINGTNIEVVLAKGTSLTSAKVRLHIAKGATVSGGLTGGTLTTTNPDYDVYEQTTVNVSSPVNFVVTSADGSPKQYQLTVKNATEQGEANLISFTLRDPAGNDYITTVDNVNRVVTTTALPYMTTDISDWKIFATASENAIASIGNTTIKPGVTEFKEDTTNSSSYTGWTDGKDKTISNAITVVSKGNTNVTSSYKLVIKFANASVDKTLTGVQVTAQKTADVKNDKGLVRAMTDANTYDAKIADKKVTITTAFSQKWSEVDYGHYLTDVTTGGGEAYVLNISGGSTEIHNLNVADPTNDTGVTARDLADTQVIVVLPEVVAKKYDAAVATSGFTTISSADLALGTQYTVEYKNVEASDDAFMTAMSVNGVNLTVGSNGKISGTIPYSMTVDKTTDVKTADDAYFLDFTISDYATLTSTSKSTTFAPKGDTNNDGEEDNAGTSNGKLVFVRDTDHKVKVYIYTGTVGSTDHAGLAVNPENTNAAQNIYNFDLKYADANTGADLTSFKLGNTSATINGTKISAVLPFGSDLKAQVASFTASEGATVSVAGSDLKSGETLLNVSGNVTITVTSEDKSKTNVYTLTATIADQFSDVNEGDWYYDNVMRAVELGILSGYSDGTFRPMNNITRRDFAIMLAQALGHDNDEPATSPFKDVADNDYGVSSIAYLYEQKITVGDDKGNFNPDDNITRQEAAIFLAKAFEATGTTSDLYTDDAKIASWAKDFVYAAKAAGLMNGDTNGTFRPTSTLTRAEAASAMVNAVDN